MSKKKNDQNFISDLLGKLKASYSAQESKSESKETSSKDNTGDADFQKQLEEMLNKTSAAQAPQEEDAPEAEKAPQAAPSSEKKKRSLKPKKEKPALPEEEPLIMPAELEETPLETEAYEKEEAYEEEEALAVSLAPEILEEEQEPILLEEELLLPEELVIPEEPILQEELLLPEELDISEEPILQEELLLPEELVIPEEPILQEALLLPEELDISDESAEPPVQELPIEEPALSLPAKEIPQPQKAENKSNTIVICPRQVKAPRQTPIVITPRASEKPAVTPRPLHQEESSAPIKIGKSAPAQTKAGAPVKKAPAANTERKAAVAPSVSRTAPAPQGNEKNNGTVRKILRKKILVKPTAEPAPEVKKQEPIEKPVVLQEPQIPYTEPVEPVVEPVVAPVVEPVVNVPVEKAEPVTPAAPPKKELPLTFSEQIYQKTGLSEDDVELLFALGYEGELANLVGDDSLKKLKSTHLRKKGKREKKAYPMAFGYRGKEYTGKEDQSAVLSAYVHDRTHLIIRLILSALCSLCLLFVENSDLRSTYGLTQFQSVSWAYPAIGILLLLVSAALSFQQIYTGIKSLFGFLPTPYSVCGVLLIPTLIYDVIALFTPSLSFSINFPISLAILITVICDMLRLCSEMRVFRLLCTKGEKNVLESTTLRKKKVMQGEKVVKVLNDEVGERFYRISKAEDVSGFFRRSNTFLHATLSFTVLIWCSLATAILLALAVAIKTQRFSAAIMAFIFFLIVGAPISAVIGFFYPLFHANRVLTHHQCALIGEESVEEYCQRKTVIWDDSEMFHTEKCTEIVLDETGDFQSDMKLASALFRKIGCTLDPLGQLSQGDNDDCTVSLTRISEHGVEATVNTHHLLAGSAGFLKKNAIRVPKESSDRILRRTESVKVMYVAIDGAVKLSYEIEYTERFSFEKMAEALSESNTSVAIRSYDPNLNTAFVQAIRHKKTETVRVFKPGRYEDNSVLELVDSGAVSLNAPEKTVCPLHAAARINKIHGFTVRMQLIATLLGGVGAFMATLFGGITVNIWHIIFYHLVWIAVSLVATHLEITEDKLHLLK